MDACVCMFVCVCVPSILFDRYHEMHIQTGSKFIDQWESRYISQAFPFVLPYMCGGPEYERYQQGGRWRRIPDAPGVTSLAWTRAMARRVEGQLRQDWTFVPAIRNLCMRYQILETPCISTPLLRGEREACSWRNRICCMAKREVCLNLKTHESQRTVVDRMP
jgi:hypothetical protein